MQTLFLATLVICASVSTAFVMPLRPCTQAARAGSQSRISSIRGIRSRPLRMVTHPDVDNEYKRKLSEQRRWTKSTKQLATLGPVSNTEEMIEKLFLAGVDVFRLNFSHGAHEEKKALFDIIRGLEVKYNHPIAILADLQGPKLRVGTFDHDKVILVDGQAFRFDLSDEPGDAARVNLPHPEIINTLQVGDTLLLDDGKLRMTVSGKGEGYVDTLVNVGGALSNRKGVNTPSVVLPISPLTPKDRKDLEFALSIGVDWVALSFVQQAQDIAELRTLVGNKAKIMAKLEKPSAVEEGVVDDIIMLSDGIMVARGDLGVEMRPEDVPVIQKQIIDKCRKYGRPVVVATQMLESMIESPTPTRAEASDVATAIYDGADAIMLSAESAAGKYPVDAVMMQQRVILRVEEDKAYRKNLARSNPNRVEKSATDAITNAAREIAATIGACALVVFTARGTTVLRASMGRPGVPILAITPEIETARSLALTWGVYPAAVETRAEHETFPDVLHKICSVAKDKGLANRPDDLLVVTAGLPFGSPGVANVIRVVPASGPEDWVVGGDKNLNTI
ncbi:pyruvate kinase [Nannochloropsis gaditana]|uniref:Pyruvate kinase n=1 Tax=Nannochloropsis gaditana TaxID=72520 RepID=W7TRP2_9STRA|nr:pyruvate kinase [Nannochloropsis gaditana]